MFCATSSATGCKPRRKELTGASTSSYAHNPSCMVARQLAGFADAIEILSPEGVRAHLAEIGRGLLRRHT